MIDWYTNQAGAELAFARAMGYEDWSFDEEPEPGIVRGVHVMWRRAHDAELPIPVDANPDDVYALVTGELPKYCIHGTIVARDGMRPEWLRQSRGKR